jgi:DNA-binding transcriptional MerR regulator
MTSMPNARCRWPGDKHREGEAVKARAYRVQEFAKAAGVSVRALHHYDRLALLEPQRSTAGYRLYSLKDLERLEQIVALKYLGLPLKDIKAVLERDARSLPDVLRAQRHALEEKRRRLDRAIDAITDAESALRTSGTADAGLLKRIIEVIDMQDNSEFFKQYYSEEAWAELAKRREEGGEELRARAEEGTRRWMALFKEIEASLDEDPAGARAQELAARWRGLIHEFTGGSAAISQGLNKVWADKANWPPTMQRQAAPFMDPRIWEFIQRAQRAMKG